MPSIRQLVPSIVLVIGAAFSSPAIAQQAQSLNVEIQYDNQAFESVEGAVIALESIEKQAVQACAFNRPLSGAPRVDETCVNAVVLKAVSQIGDAELSQALALRRATSVRVLAEK